MGPRPRSQDREDHQAPRLRERYTGETDARLVRVIDFEKAFARLSQEEQTPLAATYRDRAGQSATAFAVGCSLRKLAYLLPTARQHLADILDRLDLL